MKLRIRGNSLRLRLSQREVEQLVAERRVEESVAFGAGPASRLVYAALASEEAPAPFARFSGARIDVSLPAKLVETWASTEQIGIEAEQPLGDGGVLRLLVEKDFACLAPRTGEDDADAFPHPQAAVTGK